MITIHLVHAAIILLCVGLMLTAPPMPFGRAAAPFWCGLFALILYVLSLV